MLDFAARNHGTCVHHASSLKGEYIGRTNLVGDKVFNFRQDFASILKKILFQDFHLNSRFSLSILFFKPSLS